MPTLPKILFNRAATTARASLIPSAFVGGLLLLLLAGGVAQAGVRPSSQGARSAANSPRAHLVPLQESFAFPAPADSNSPAYWNDEGDLVLFTSAAHPAFSVGRDAAHLTHVGDVLLEGELPGGRWLEAVIRADDRTLYGYYHYEPPGICPDSNLTAPEIGAMVSLDDGQSWRDLGIVLTARAGFLHCDTINTYFAGGVGDFAAILDKDQRYVLFFFTSYAGELGEEGVAVARLAWEDRDEPVGKVFKFFDGQWLEPGLGGPTTAIYPTLNLWEDPETDAFWGPSIHWNTHLRQYVMLLNRSVGMSFRNEGLYVAFAPSLDDPNLWSDPQKILEDGDWYPQVLGLEPGTGTDTVAGQEAWFCVSGRCDFRIRFEPASPAGAGLVTSARAGVLTGVAASATPVPRAPSAAQPRRRRG